MTYREAREFIDNSGRYGSKLGLTAITELMKRLGNPQEKLKIIHVAGTNGKGSTTAMLAAILTAEGYLVGRYISPAVFSYRERIQIGTEAIAEQAVGDTMEAIKPVCEAMVKDGFGHPTTFELETAMAFLYFAREQVDFAVIEVGLGGRLDATNVIRHPVLSVITSVSMDHMQYLGDTLEKITREKAGIIKKGAPVVTGNRDPRVIGVIRQVCHERGVRLIEAAGDIFVSEAASGTASALSNIRLSPEGSKFSYEGQEYEFQLSGEHQIANAVLAIQAAKTLRELGYAVKESSIINGLKQARWGGRLEILARKPYFIIDGAHNEDAALQLRKVLLDLYQDTRKIFILGVLADKDYEKILKITAPLAGVIITVTPDNSRALASSLLAREAGAYTDARIIDAGSIENAVKAAYEQARPEDMILAFGSLSYLGALKEYRSEWEKQLQ